MARRETPHQDREADIEGVAQQVLPAIIIRSPHEGDIRVLVCDAYAIANAFLMRGDQRRAEARQRDEEEVDG